MVIDASLRFEEKRWRHRVENTIDKFIANEIDLDSFLGQMYDLGYENGVTEEHGDV